jgi:hypothetical protein
MLTVFTSDFTARLAQIAACSLLWSNPAIAPAGATERPSSQSNISGILGDCGDQSCSTLLETLRQQWAWQVQDFEASCRHHHRLLGMWVSDSEPHVSFSCWDQPFNEQGKRTGLGLGRLPLPGQEVDFRASVCETDSCRSDLAALRQRFPDQIPQIETECAIRSGMLIPNAPSESGDSSRTDLICTGFFYEWVDLNQDGYPDGDDAIPTSGPIATVWTIPPGFLNAAVTSRSTASKITGNCSPEVSLDDQPDLCDQLFRALQTQRPVQMRPYIEQCGSDQILELETYYTENQLSSVTFTCWSRPDTTGARLSFQLWPVLDLGGSEQKKDREIRSFSLPNSSNVLQTIHRRLIQPF